MNKSDLHGILDAVWSFLAGITPGAIGAAVAVAYEKQLSWGQRFLQFAIGIIVSYFATLVVRENTSFGPFLQQSISFTVGLIAYKAVPNFTDSAAETARSVPKDLWGFIKKKLGMGD